MHWINIIKTIYIAYFLFSRNIIYSELFQRSKCLEKKKRAWSFQFLRQRAMSTTTIACTKESLSSQNSSFIFSVSLLIHCFLFLI